MEVRCGENIERRLPLETLDDAAEYLRLFFGSNRGIVVNGAGNSAPDVVLRLWAKLRNHMWIYDVYDWFLYDATGLKLAQWWLTDRAYRFIAARCCLLSKDLLSSYPRAFHLENASHLVPSRRVKSFDKRIVVIASYDRRTDFGLLRSLAEAAPDMAIDMYGSVYADDRPTTDALRLLTDKFKNVHHHGRFELDQLQELLDSYLIGLLPYCATDVMTRFIVPDKLFHYLCAGLEVITTPIPVIRYFDQHVHAATDANAILSAIRRIAELGERRNPGDLHEVFNWWRRAREFCDAIQPAPIQRHSHNAVEQLQP
jgi:hypothetical protein